MLIKALAATISRLPNWITDLFGFRRQGPDQKQLPTPEEVSLQAQHVSRFSRFQRNLSSSGGAKQQKYADICMADQVHLDHSEPPD
jgi:hypothetical protein